MNSTIRIVLIGIFLSIFIPHKAQQLTLEELIPGGTNYAKYRPEMPRQLQWYENKLVFVKSDTVFYFQKDGKKDILLDLKSLNSGLKECKFSSLPSVSFLKNKTSVALLKSDSIWLLYDLKNKKQIEQYILHEDGANFDFSESSYNVAYTVKNNLYIAQRGKEIAVTNDKDNDNVYGQSVHRNEFGIQKGTFWSPSGSFLAFYRMDESMVTDYPLVDVSARVAKLENIKYPMAGMASHHVSVAVYNINSKETVYLKTGQPLDKYLTNIAWSPDEKYIYLAEINRGQDTCKLNRYNATTGAFEKTLFVETNSKYVESEHPIYFTPNNPNQFLWLSKRDGYNHFYLYNADGTLIKQITKGNWDVMDVVAQNKNQLIYTSKERSPIETHIYTIDIKTLKKKQLSTEKGVHYAIANAEGTVIADIYQSQYNPGKIVTTIVASSKSELLYTAKNPFENIQLPKIEIGTIKSTDGTTDLYYRMVKPLNFDSTKHYPVILYVYGGPHSQMIDNSWMAQVRGWDIYMAQKGYLIFTLDNRGTSNRGAAFENIIHRHLGEVETADQMAGVDYLKSLAYVDASRIGVHGWSYGGFMTTTLMLRHNDVFKVGVAGGPVMDWKYYEIMYGERYMDTPLENPEGYEKSSLLEQAQNLKGRLLIIHGDEDPTVVMQHSLLFLKASIKAGTHPDFFVYPGHGHNMRGRDRVHLHEHITRYFDDFLK